jgi:hypothetical protein
MSREMKKDNPIISVDTKKKKILATLKIMGQYGTIKAIHRK